MGFTHAWTPVNDLLMEKSSIRSNTFDRLPSGASGASERVSSLFSSLLTPADQKRNQQMSSFFYPLPFHLGTESLFPLILYRYLFPTRLGR